MDTEVDNEPTTFALAMPIASTPFGRLRAMTVDVDPVMPSSAAVVIIGAGIAGLTTALCLAEQGVSVVVCEKGHVAGEQSSRALGLICNAGLDPVKMELTAASKRLWAQLNQRLGHETGYRRSGLLHLCDTQNDLQREEGWLAAVGASDAIDARIIGADEVAALLPGSTRSWAGALYQPSDGQAEPRIATSAIARAARRLGVRILAPCAVRAIETQAGRVSGVVTERGHIRAGSVVIAGGVWSRLICGNAGVHLPMLRINSPLLRTGPVPHGPAACAAAHGFAFRRQLDGGYSIGPDHGHTASITPDSFLLFRQFLPALRKMRGILRFSFGREFFEELRTPRRWRADRASPFEARRMLDPNPDESLMRDTLATMARVLPAFEGAAIKEIWAGMIDATADSVPVIAPVISRPGLFLNTGFSAYGLTMGPAAGQLMADLVTGKRAFVDPKPYRYERYIDGSPLRVAP